MTADQLIRRDRWSPARMQAHQRDALRAALEHACAASPYYREALGPDAAQRPLHELPTLPKRTLVDEWDRIVTDPGLRLADVEAHATGPRPPSPTEGASGGAVAPDRRVRRRRARAQPGPAAKLKLIKATGL